MKYSNITSEKEYRFNFILNAHIKIVKGILKRSDWTNQQYYYYDLNAGTGIIEELGNILGSPLQFLEIADKNNMPFNAIFIDNNKKHINELTQNIAKKYKNWKQNIKIIHTDNKDYLRSLQKNPPLKPQYGLIYHDPYGDPIFNELSILFKDKHFDFLDILVNCPATTVKRVGKAFNRETLEEHLKSINKKHWIIREPAGKQQWSFLIGTNWTNFPKFETLGFYPFFSLKGQNIFKKLNYTAIELKEMNYRRFSKYVQMALF